MKKRKTENAAEKNLKDEVLGEFLGRKEIGEKQ